MKSNYLDIYRTLSIHIGGVSLLVLVFKVEMHSQQQLVLHNVPAEAALLILIFWKNFLLGQLGNCILLQTLPQINYLFRHGVVCL